MINIPEEIVDAIACDRLIFFVGAGFSQNLNIPNWNHLAKKAIDYYANENDDTNLLKECLDKHVLDEILVFDALKRISVSKIHKIIKDNVNIRIDKSQLVEHYKLWKITNKIITTNYDKALENSKPYSEIETVTHTSVQEIVSTLKGNKWLYHIHGRIDNIDECIIFSEDYVELYSKRHKAAEQLKNLAQQTIVFIGFSMRDKYVSKLFKELDLLFEQRLLEQHYIILKEDEELPIKHLNKLSIQSYSHIPELLNKLIDIKKSNQQCKIPVKRYLRRRSRAFKMGTADFNKLVNNLLLEPVDAKDKDEMFQKIIDFSNLYEKTILKALFYENIAEIENMIETLSSESFENEEELTRKLYLAIAFEKIDYLNDAKKLLNQITAYPLDNEIIVSAKFNLSICNEKSNDLSEVYFENFISTDINIKSTKEKLKHKAINNLLVVCHKTGTNFKFEKDLELLLESQSEQSPKSFYKTLINYYTYKNIKIEKNEFNEIFELSKNMTTNSRATLICQLYKTSNKQTKEKVKVIVLQELEKILKTSNSKSVSKHINDLKKEINGK